MRRVVFICCHLLLSSSNVYCQKWPLVIGTNGNDVAGDAIYTANNVLVISMVGESQFFKKEASCTRAPKNEITTNYLLCLDTAGNTLARLFIQGKNLCLVKLGCDRFGNFAVSGTFQKYLLLCGDTIASKRNQGGFVLAFDKNYRLKWKYCLKGEKLNFRMLSADDSGNWYCGFEFDHFSVSGQMIYAQPILPREPSTAKLGYRMSPLEQLYSEAAQQSYGQLGVIKLDRTGKYFWHQCIPGYGFDVSRQGYLIGGYETTFKKYDPNGHNLWVKSLADQARLSFLHFDAKANILATITGGADTLVEYTTEGLRKNSLPIERLGGVWASSTSNLVFQISTDTIETPAVLLRYFDRQSILDIPITVYPQNGQGWVQLRQIVPREKEIYCIWEVQSVEPSPTVVRIGDRRITATRKSDVIITRHFLNQNYLVQPDSTLLMDAGWSRTEGSQVIDIYLRGRREKYEVEVRDNTGRLIEKLTGSGPCLQYNTAKLPDGNYSIYIKSKWRYRTNFSKTKGEIK